MNKFLFWFLLLFFNMKIQLPCFSVLFGYVMNQCEVVCVSTELDDGVCNPLWTMKGFTQTFHFLKESRRAQSLPLNALLTYVTVPWFSIIAGN